MTPGWYRRETMGAQRLQDVRASRRREARTAAMAKPTPGKIPTKGSSSFAAVVARVRSPVPDFGGPGRFLLIAARPAEDVVAPPVIPVSRVAACE